MLEPAQTTAGETGGLTGQALINAFASGDPDAIKVLVADGARMLEIVARLDTLGDEDKALDVQQLAIEHRRREIDLERHTLTAEKQAIAARVGALVRPAAAKSSVRRISRKRLAAAVEEVFLPVNPDDAQLVDDVRHVVSRRLHAGVDGISTRVIESILDDLVAAGRATKMAVRAVDGCRTYTYHTIAPALPDPIVP